MRRSRRMVPCLTPTSTPSTVIKCSALFQDLFIYPDPLTMPRFPNGNRSRVEIGVLRWLHQRCFSHPRSSFSSVPLFVFFALFPLCFSATFLVPRCPLARPSMGLERPLFNSTFHFDFPKFSVKCQTVVDWIGCALHSTPSSLSLFFPSFSVSWNFPRFRPPEKLMGKPRGRFRTAFTLFFPSPRKVDPFAKRLAEISSCANNWILQT